MRRARLAWQHLTRERIPDAIARRLPRRVVYYAAIRLWAHGTTGRYGRTIAPELTVADAIERWEPARHEEPRPANATT